MTTATMEAPAKAGKSAAVRLPLTSLRESLTKLSPALSGPATIPVLKSVLIAADEDEVSFTATNLELAIRVAVSREPGAAVSFLMPSDRFLSYVKLLEGDMVALQAGKDRVTLTAGRAVTKFPTLEAGTFPKTSFGMTDGGATFSQAAALELIRHTSFAVSDEETRFTLKAGLLEFEDGAVTLVATDGHRLAMFRVQADVKQRAAILVPGDLLFSLSKVMSDDPDKMLHIGDVAEAISCEVVTGETGSVSLSHRKIAGQFPNYKAVVPSGSGVVRIEVSVDEMLASLNRCVAMSDKRTTAVKMTLGAEQILLKAVDSEAGETVETVGYGERSVFPEFVTGFNGHYLVDALKRLSGNCVLEFAKADGQTALKITQTTGEGGEFTYVVMPIRV